MESKCVRVKSVTVCSQWHTIKLQFNADNVRLGLRRAFWFPSYMGMADFILAGVGDLYDMNEYHMLAHITIRK